MLPLLNETERGTLERYVVLLRERLGPRLLSVSVFGSVARGESWPAGMRLGSDLDLLVPFVPISCAFRHGSRPVADTGRGPAGQVGP